MDLCPITVLFPIDLHFSWPAFQHHAEDLKINFPIGTCTDFLQSWKFMVSVTAREHQNSLSGLCALKQSVCALVHMGILYGGGGEENTK